LNLDQIRHIQVAQEALCRRFEAPCFGCDLTLKLGISANVRDGVLPLNGLRVASDAGTSGWFIWAGETLSEDPGFFLPLHGLHLEEWAPSVLPYLGLPPGWRFLVAQGHEDVWKDEDIVLD
jgi:hypothetical protein